jgi:predicted nuclease of predicted toxin-antitoxin system
VRFLLDQGVPRSVVTALRGLGVDATHATDVGMATALDHELMKHARSEQQVVVTLDADFHALLALANAASPSVVRVRIEGLRGTEFAALIVQVIALCEADLRVGAMITVDERRIRVRRLPLVT